MESRVYSLLDNIQFDIMLVVDEWAHHQNSPIARSYIIKNLKKKKVVESTTIWSINSLIRKGYLRRAVSTSNKSYYVQLKRV